MNVGDLAQIYGNRIMDLRSTKHVMATNTNREGEVICFQNSNQSGNIVGERGRTIVAGTLALSSTYPGHKVS